MLSEDIPTVVSLNSNNICVICQQNREENDEIHSIKECSHTFHTNCIIEWFRTGNDKCPLCRNSEFCSVSPIMFYSPKSRLNFMKNYSRRKVAPEQLKNLVKSASKTNQRIKSLIKERKEWSQSVEGREFASLKKIYNKLNNKIIKTKQRYRSINNDIISYPLVPLYSSCNPQIKNIIYE